MPCLILLNGPPASGKSTLARRLVERRPLALNLDIDIVRHQLGSWSDRPTDAGLAARRLAVAMAAAHLGAGLDVVVPQFLGQVDFIEQLEDLSRAHGAPFHEVMLQLGREEAAEAFRERRLRSSHPVDADAALLVDRADSKDPIGDMYDTLNNTMAKRPSARRLAPQRGNIDATVEHLLELLAWDGLDW